MFKGLLSNPEFLAGASIIGSRGNIGKGLLGYSQMQNAMTRNKLAEMQMQAMKQQQDQLNAQRLAFGRPGGQVLDGPPDPGQTRAPVTAGTGVFAQDPSQRQLAFQKAALAGPNSMANMLALQPKPLKPTTSIQEYQEAVRQGFKGTFMDYKTALNRAGATNVSQIVGGKLSPGQKKIDETVAQDVAEFGPGGKSADTEKMLSQLEEVHNALGDPDKNLTGPVIGNLPKWMLNVTNPEAVDTREAVEEVVQRNLKAILGAQFTEKEGERLISRAYNPSLDEATNRKRVGRLIAQIKAAHAAKKSAADYFRQHGTMRGWDGKEYSFDDFYGALDEDKETYDLNDIDKLLKKYGG